MASIENNILQLDISVIANKLIENQNAYIELCLLEETFPETNAQNEFTKKIVKDFDDERDVKLKELNDVLNATPVDEKKRDELTNKLEKIAHAQRPFIQATKQLDRQLDFIKFDKDVKIKAINFLGKILEEKKKSLTK